MYWLAKAGFTQSYTYFAWRNTKYELMQYFNEVTEPPVSDFFRPNAWPNTPDILTEYLQYGGRPAFVVRLILAATLSANYGIYGPAFELGENLPAKPGSEEYLNSEKYEIRQWDRAATHSLAPLITQINQIRRDNPAAGASRSGILCRGCRPAPVPARAATAAHAAAHNRKDFVGNALGAVVVTSWQGVPYPPGEEKVFLTTLPVDDPLAVLDHYRLRSLIENTAFRELKQGWALEHAPKKTAAAVRAHVVLTLVTFTLVNAFRSKSGQAVARRGMRRWRAQEDQQTVIVFAAGYYAIFDIEEVFILLGVIPAACLSTDPATVRRKYGLPPAG